MALAGDPAGSGASAAIERLRDDYVPAAFDGVDAPVYVTGPTALNLDYATLIDRWLPIVITFVLTLSFLLLLLVFRSVVLPLKAVVLNLLSVGAAYGLMVLVFQEGIGAGPARTPADRPGRAVGAGLPVLRAVRPVHGLPRLPADPDP